MTGVTYTEPSLGPDPGLVPYNVEDADVYFGREGENVCLPAVTRRPPPQRRRAVREPTAS